MPAIDIYTPDDLLDPDAERQLVVDLTYALLRAEGAPIAEPFLGNTAAYVHRLPSSAVHTAASAHARTVRVQVLTPPGALDRRGQQTFVSEATRIVASASREPGQEARTWVFLTEAAEGGWGVAGVALGRDEFAALRKA